MDNERNLLTQSVFRSISDGLIVVDQKGIVLDINVPAAYALDITAKSCVGNHFFERLNSKDLENQLVDIFAEPDIYSIKRFEITVADRTFRVSFDPIFSDTHERIGILVVLHDVTDERRLLSAKDELMWTASHEFYTPLTAIKGNLEYLAEQKELKTGDNKIAIQDATDGLYRALRIARDILDITSIETGRAEFKNDKFELAKVIEEAVKALEPKILEKKLKISLDLTDIGVRGDRPRVLEILKELILNAVKFSDTGTITIKTYKDNHCYVDITDNGLGIDSKEIDLLFTKFGRVTQALKDFRGGIGLGLYKIKLYAESMGGSIRLKESSPGKGSTFTLELLP